MILKIALVQTDIVWGCKAANLAAAETAAASTDAHLVVFPEMFTTGFMTEATADYAESMDGETVSRMCATAVKTDKAIAGSVIIKTDEGTFNRLIFAKPDGTIEWYDKRHLFSYSGEDKLYSSGKERVIINYKGFRIMPLVCYDLRFPVWSRNRQDYDVALYVASWPESRIPVWDVLLSARAIENQCYILGVNRVGDDPTSSYNGHSTAIDYMGRSMASLPDSTAGVIRADLDLDALSLYRNRFRAWADSDDFSVII